MKSGVLSNGRVSLVEYLNQRGLRGNEHPYTLKERLQRTRLENSKNLYKTDLYGHFGCVNAIEFSNRGGELLVSGGDDRRVLLWHIEKSIHNRAKPLQLKGQHQSNIFCLAFDSENTRIFSGGNDEQVILHDLESGHTVDVFPHEEAVYGLSVNPVNDNVFASSADDGRVLIWDIRESVSGEPFCLAHYPSAFHSVMFNPAEPRLLATANSKEGVGLWDIRKPRSALLRYGGNLSLQSAMSVRFNGNGTQLLALRRRLPPVLYDIHSRLPVFQFDNQGYFNSCTMKSCCFAGDHDQYILSGSDDFNLYMWRIPSDPEAGGPGRVVNGAFLVLKGHRSIVNQVRFNRYNYMICSSGVEKIIKVWSPYRQPECSGDLEGKVEDESRSLYSHEEYISLVLSSRSGDLSHDYANQSIQEDPRMMAFFDSLVRREIEGWSSDSESDVSASTILQLRTGDRSAYSDSESSTSLPQFPRQAEESEETVFNLGLRATSDPTGTREDVISRQKRLMALRRYQDARLLALNDSDSDDNNYHQMDTDSDTDPIPRPRSPSPENDTSSTSSEEEDELNKRRASTRQRNASRQKPKPKLEERTDTNPENTDICPGVDIFEYPQIKIDDVSSSPASSPERCQVERTASRVKVPLCSSTEYEERKIYKAYKWLQCSYKAHMASKDGDHSSNLIVEHEEESPGTSEKDAVGSNENEVHTLDNRTSVSPSHNRDLSVEDVSKSSSSQVGLIIEGNTTEVQQSKDDQDRVSALGNSNNSVEYCFESRRVNGKAPCKALGNQSEETCGRRASAAFDQRNSQDCQTFLGKSSQVITENSFPVIVTCNIHADGQKSISDIQTPAVSEEGCTETVCANHNGRLHSTAVHCSSSRQGGDQEHTDLSLAMHSVCSGSGTQTEGICHRQDHCILAADCSANGVGTREDISDLQTRDVLSCDDSEVHTGLKRHRTEAEDVDPENCQSEKKLKT
ncbi:DDB1- and CUL4-associated factor 5 [Protopterus annectens]|uniref:DDB1- and CUL4-associated factor 5 n=1 Tax=Protopterus annectens TaxID=7888 RepID=UPI001CFC08B7|nr:DDB1- and CUL4-associated factor 5 [Protopterus annectens]